MFKALGKLIEDMVNGLSQVRTASADEPTSPPSDDSTVTQTQPTDQGVALAATGELVDKPYETLGARTSEEAKQLYDDTKENDPFPDIPPALLNSAHIEDYMLATAMVFPYHRERRKSASYAMRLGSEIAFWDPDRPKREIPIRPLQDRELFRLPPNSLVYVKTKELFQLPNYIAVRFNLHIDLVHKGLLLGTGPLVDPGFRGHLMIPLHNMTSNTYYLAEGDELIWAEFTKTSMKPEWMKRATAGPRREPEADFADFPKDKSNKKMFDYFSRALTPHDLREGKRPYPFPANAIPKGVRKAEDEAGAARTDAQKAREAADQATGAATRIRNWGIGTILAVGIALVTLIWVTMQMVQATVGLADTTAERVRGLSGQVDLLRRDIAARDLIAARAALADFCTVPGTSLQSQGERRRLAVRVKEAEMIARESAKAAANPDPFPESLTLPPDGSAEACTRR